MRELKRFLNYRELEKGISLIIAVFSMMVLAVLGLTMAMIISGDFDMNTRDQESEQAFNLADAGIQEAVSRLKTNSTLFDNDAKWLNRKLANGEYNVTRLTNATQISVFSSGYVPNQQLRRAMRQVKLIVRSGSGFSLGNAVYSTGNVDISGNAQVTGNVTSSGVVEGDEHVNGTITENAPPVALPPVIVPDPPLSSPSSGVLSVSGNNQATLSAGNYKYSSISLSGNSRLTIYGPTNIYLTGSPSFSTSGNANLVITGGQVNIYINGALSIGGNGVIGNSQNVKYLTFFGTANNHSTVGLSGNGNFYGVIYAPTMGLSISGNGNYYGAYIGNNVTMNGNAEIHFDPSLSSSYIGGSGGLSIISWQEQ